METEAQRAERTRLRLAETEGAWNAGLLTPSTVSFLPAHPELVGPCTYRWGSEKRHTVESAPSPPGHSAQWLAGGEEGPVAASGHIPNLDS